MTILRIVLAVIVGAIIGGIVNMGLVILGSGIIPAPDGVDVTNAESIAASAHLFQPKHFVVPFLAHAVGTFVGALAGYLIATSRKNVVAYVIGVFYLAGGIVAATMIPAPAWFVAADLIIAYLPMAALAIKVGSKLRPE